MNLCPPFQIKICGITRATDAISVARAGADAIGMNFFEGSSRYLSPNRAAEIAQTLTGFCQNGDWRKPLIFGVFVNCQPEDIANLVAVCNLDGIQFHGDESPFIMSEVSKLVSKSGLPHANLKMVRAIRIPASVDLDGQASIRQEAEDWAKAGAQAILLDSGFSGGFGGSGHAFDWKIVPQLNLGLPIILAGGLNPENVRQAIKVSQVRAVDVASGVESAPGIKDEQMIIDFVKCTGLVR